MDWRPIETAPKDDGPVVLLYWDILAPINGVFAAYWDEFENEWVGMEWDGWDPIGLDVEPTHWMPLPAPPTDTEE